MTSDALEAENRRLRRIMRLQEEVLRQIRLTSTECEVRKLAADGLLLRPEYLESSRMCPSVPWESLK